MSRYIQMEKAYNFFKQCEKEGRVFTLKEICEHSSWKVQTFKTHCSKKLFDNIQILKDGFFEAHGFRNMSIEEFKEKLSQKGKKGEDSETSTLIVKAREFAMLAVSTYNNPYSNFKTHGFIVNIIIAYTALFHAIFERDGVSYFYEDKDGRIKKVMGEEKAWELSQCLHEYYKKTCAQSENLKFLIGLRNKIEHRGLPEIDLAVAGYCQSALTNFENILVEEFGDRYSLMLSLAFSMQLSKSSSAERDAAIRTLKSESYNLVSKYIDAFNEDLSEDIFNDQKYRLNVYLLPVISQNRRKSDLCISYIDPKTCTESELESLKKTVALIKKVKTPYELKPGDVVRLIKKKFPDFNMNKHIKAWKYFNARPAKEGVKNHENEFCSYSKGFDGYLYSDKWVVHLRSHYMEWDKNSK